MARPARLSPLAALLLAITGAHSAVHAAGTIKLSVFAAGTLADPFREIDRLFSQKYPDVVVEPQFGGSVKMARQIAELHQPADVIAVADYSVIPKYLFAKNGRPAYAAWYAGFARNAVAFVCTDKSKYAGEVTPENWYRILARPGVEIGRSNPDTDPSGYQTLQMLSLAEGYYHMPGLAAQILANAPPANMRDTETELIAALELGQIDYLAIYRSDALQHHFRHLDLPAQIDLSDPVYGKPYAGVVAHTKNGDIPGKPIVYAVAVTTDAAHPDWAETYVGLLLGPEGQQVMKENGFGGLAPAYAPEPDKVPPSLRQLVKPWPAP